MDTTDGNIPASACSNGTTRMTQQGPWIGRLEVRVLGPHIDEEYCSKKPQCTIDPSRLCKGSGTRQCVPWTTATCRENPIKDCISATDCESTGLQSPDIDVPNHLEKGGVTTLDLYLFETCNDEILQVEQIHLKRESEELIDRTLKRLGLSLSRRINVAKSKQKRKKNSKEKNTKEKNSKPDASCVVYTRRVAATTSAPKIDKSSHWDEYKPWNVSGMTNSTVWKQSMLLIDGAEASAQQHTDIAISVSVESAHAVIPIQVQVCPPTVESVCTFENFQAKLFVGVPLVVTTTVLYATHAVVNWYAQEEMVCCDNPCYTPTSSDIGKKIYVLITPTRADHNGNGCEEAYCFLNVVEPLPQMPIVSPLRSDWVKGRSPSQEPRSSLRVLTYNILADQNAYPRSFANVSNLYPYCDFEFLARTRRMPMLLYEILAYRADIICLQEVDMLVYESLFQPVLECKGYQGYYSVKKTGSTREGCAMFWSLECFEPIAEEEMKTHVIRDLFPKTSNDSWESINVIAELLQKHDNLRDVIQNKLGHVLQVTSLTLKRSRSNQTNVPKRIVIANTHLFFHPDASHIRVMQLLVSCRLLDTVRRSFGGATPCPFVFCGDFNSTRQSGACRLMFQRSVPPSYGSTWKHLQNFVWERNNQNEERIANANDMAQKVNEQDDSIQAPTISLSPEFPLLCSGYGNIIPNFTHYIVGFVGTLDYILASQPGSNGSFGFVPKQWAPMPSEHLITEHVAMPNEFMPSDHISLVCDLEFVTTKNNG